MMNQYLNYSSPIGNLCLVASDLGLAGVFFDQHAHHQHDTRWELSLTHPILLTTSKQLTEYFLGHRQEFDIPLDQSQGTVFQRQVWSALTHIPYGHVWDYSQLAVSIKNPNAVRAVGAANGRNPLSIIVPCHRVISRSGAMQGYAGGVEQKIRLLQLEKEILSKKIS